MLIKWLINKADLFMKTNSVCSGPQETLIQVGELLERFAVSS